MTSACAKDSGGATPWLDSHQEQLTRQIAKERLAALGDMGVKGFSKDPGQLPAQATFQQHLTEMARVGYFGSESSQGMCVQVLAS